MGGELALFLFLLGMSAFFSGAETALTSLSEIKVHKLVAERGKLARPLERWIEHPGHFMATILICNNIANVGASALATVVTYEYFEGAEGIAISVATGFTTIFILMFGEITPKNFCKAHSEGMAIVVIRPLIWLSFLLWPAVRLFSWASAKVVGLLSFGRTPSSEIFSEEELKASFKIGRARGVLEGHEKDMLNSVLEFSDTRVAEIMVPRVEMDALPVTASLDEIRRIMIESGRSRLPIHEGALDQLLGILHVREVLGASESIDVRAHLRKPLFIPESTTLPRVLKQMKRRQLHMAMVVNEYGGVEGLVTMEDVLEELVGEIEDEHDEVVAFVERTDDGTVRLDARLNLRDAARELGIEMPETTVITLGGFLIERFGRIPRRGDQLVHDDLEFTVLEATRRRMSWVEVRPLHGRALPPVRPPETSVQTRALSGPDSEVNP